MLWIVKPGQRVEICYDKRMPVECLPFIGRQGVVSKARPQPDPKNVEVILDIEAGDPVFSRLDEVPAAGSPGNDLVDMPVEGRRIIFPRYALRLSWINCQCGTLIGQADCDIRAGEAVTIDPETGRIMPMSGVTRGAPDAGDQAAGTSDDPA